MTVKEECHGEEYMAKENITKTGETEGFQCGYKEGGLLPSFIIFL